MGAAAFVEVSLRPGFNHGRSSERRTLVLAFHRAPKFEILSFHSLHPTKKCEKAMSTGRNDSLSFVMKEDSSILKKPSTGQLKSGEA
jgi:hypothetical protein